MLAMEMKTSGMYVSRGLSYVQAEVSRNLLGWERPPTWARPPAWENISNRAR